MSRPVVLIVEDSPSVRHLIEVSLRPLDVRFDEAETGVEGWEYIQAHEPQVVVLDIGLPGIDGWEVLRRVRADSRFADVSVLVLTAHHATDGQDLAVQRGADALVAKPFDPRALRNRSPHSSTDSGAGASIRS